MLICLGAILMQGNTISDAKPVAVVSRTTNAAEKKYPQLDLEAVAKDFALRRFTFYLVGAPDITAIIDHKPLCSIFNGKKINSDRSRQIVTTEYRIYSSISKGKINPIDYLSRRGKSFVEIPREQEEADDIKDILHMLHTTIQHLSYVT